MENGQAGNQEDKAQTAEGKKDAQFDAQLAALMVPGGGGNGKKGRRRWSKKRKMTVAAVVILLVVGIPMGRKIIGGGKAPLPMVSVTTLSKGDIEEKLVVSGPISGTDSVDVVSNLHAEIVEMPVKEGMRVEKDQLLAVIDRSDIDKEITIAQNSYDLSVANYNEKQRETETGYAKARQDLLQAQRDFDRNNTLLATGDVTQADWEVSHNALMDAKRQVESYTVRDGRAVADESFQLQVQNAKLELDRKKEMVDDIELRSPIAGTVVRVYTKVGRFADTVKDDLPLFSIENLDVLEMKINVSEYSIGKVAVGQPVSIRADILNGKTVRGEVTAISPTGEEKGGGSTERVIPTTIQILEPDSRLMAGITAKAEITLAQAKDTWIVPPSCLMEQDDGQFVQAVENGAIRWIPVETGVESDIEIEVKPRDGAELAEGMQIVASPSPDMADGSPVGVLPQM